MAIKTFNCNLNGGDESTVNNDLFYRIYGSSDNYTTPIATTGSHNSDADVTVTADVVEIVNVDVGTETSYKIAAVDEAGNEGILSPAISPYILDSYAGKLGLSFYKLKASAVYACQVRRNDGVTTDVILEDSGPITVNSLVSAGGTLAAWSSGNYPVDISKWYDQSGNGDDAVEDDVNAYPELINGAGNPHQFGGEMAWRSASGKQLWSPRQLSDNLWTMFSCFFIDDVSLYTSETILSQHTGAADVNRVIFMMAQAADNKNVMNFNDGASQTGQYSTDVQDGAQLWTSLAKNDDYFMKVNNGALEEVLSNLPFVPLDDHFRIGSQGLSEANPLVGYMKEVIVFDSDQTSNRVAIEADMNSRHAVY